MALEDRDVSKKASSNVVQYAERNGAEALITACPLCLYNLNENGSGLNKASKIPVYYFTELLAVALGVKQDKQEGVLARAC